MVHEISSDCKNLDNQTSLSRPKSHDSKAMLKCPIESQNFTLYNQCKTFDSA